jgi:DNA-binding NarL/FixJ family response regulator
MIRRRIRITLSGEPKQGLGGDGFISQRPQESPYLRRSSPTSPSSLSKSGNELTEREREVVRLLAEGNSNKEVATLLNIAVGTAQTHRAHIMLKLNIHSLAHLVRYALQNKLVVF